MASPLQPVCDDLKKIIEKVLNIPVEEIGEEDSFMDLGIDSISGVEFIRSLNEHFELSLEAVALYDYFNLKKLAGFISKECKHDTLFQEKEKTTATEPKSLSITNVSRRSSEIKNANNESIKFQPSSREDIAVIGISGKFPGADTVNEFWSNLCDGKDSITEIPSRKWKIAEWYSSDKDLKGKTYGKWMGSVNDEDKFDASFFNISPREAERMDPQQRLFIEECWKAIEDAGYAAESLSGKKCGVFVGAGPGDYYDRFRNEQELDSHVLTGTTASILASRIAYFLDLQGPAIATDTACSSSLVAIHQACQSIRTGECELAIAGGVYIQTTPRMHVMTSKAEMLSSDGKCYTFDTRANGFVPGEAVGVIILKPLSQALKDQDHIYGLIKGSGINQDGRTNGMMAPSAHSQMRLMKETYERYEISPSSISYVETHGTGTKLGDPIEIKALKEVFSSDEKRVPCGLGSVKTNIGHTLTAAGICGFIKLMLSLKNECIPPTLNYKKLNEHIDLHNSPFFIADQLQVWKRENNSSLRAAISSFGYSGTNVHMIVEEFVRTAYRQQTATDELFVLSARTKEQLLTKSKELKQFLTGQPSVLLTDVAFTLSVGRTMMEARLAIVARNTEQLLVELDNFITGSKGAYLTGHSGPAKRETVSSLAANVQHQDLYVIAREWLDGRQNDLSYLFTGRQCYRLSLPLYPFSKERYWFEDKTQVVQHQQLLSASTWETEKNLDSNESLFTDHQLNDMNVLPGVAYMHMVKEAVGQQLNTTINSFENVRLFKPVVAKENPVQLKFSFTSGNGSVSYQVNEMSDNENTLVASGTCSATDPVRPLAMDIYALKRRFTKSKTRLKCYEFFHSLGLNYGPSFQGIETLYVNEEEALAKIHIQENTTYTHEGLMDSALQACIGINFGKLFTELVVPVRVKQIISFGNLSGRMWSYARKSGNTSDNAFDVDLLNEQGEVLMYFREMTVLPVPGKKQQQTAEVVKPETRQLLYVPRWSRLSATNEETVLAGKHLIVGADENNSFFKSLKNWLLSKQVEVISKNVLDQVPADVQHVYLLHGLNDDPSQRISDKSFEEEEYAVFRVIKKLLTSSFNKRGAQLTVFTLNTQKVFASDHVSPAGSGIVGLIGSLAKEQPLWKISMIDLDQDADMDKHWSNLLQRSFSKNGNVIASRKQLLFQSELVPFTRAELQPSRLKMKGTYVLLGGAGGIGRVTSEYLVKKYKANIIWLGRREQDQTICAAQDAIAELGSRPLYISCDASNKEDVEYAYKKIKSMYAQVDGIFHTAIVLKDSLIKNMTEKDFKMAFDPKAIATHYLLETFSTEPLDFICFYSSIQSQVNAAGQSNYAAGCNYKDSYAHAFQEGKENTNIYIINWGYWGQVGIVANKEYQERLASFGLESINEYEGMQVLEHVLSGDQKQLAAVKFINQ
ncbi:MAG TPA: type I polyketide synthase [Bacteroidia bacterium]|nr:type I polyketide synthase [Bacteroidia bacterium]